jgi:large subunit ribosomal protein L29
VAKEKTNIQELTIPEVEEKIREMKKEVFTLRFRNAMRQLDNPLRIRFLRRDIARYTTALAEHQKGIRFLATGEDLPLGGETAPAKPKAAKKAVKKAASKVAAKPATKAAPKKKEEAVAEAKTASATKSSEKPKRRVPWSRGKKKDKE